MTNLDKQIFVDLLDSDDEDLSKALEESVLEYNKQNQRDMLGQPSNSTHQQAIITQNNDKFKNPHDKPCGSKQSRSNYSESKVIDRKPQLFTSNHLAKSSIISKTPDSDNERITNNSNRPSPDNTLTLTGFDTMAGNTWIYPTNFPVREYQFKIVENSLFTNTMVVLPTGLGKTFIAAVIMYNFYRWYPQGKVIFMAPTRPLVSQQIEACFNIMGIPQLDTVIMTGVVNQKSREESWRTKRVFFLTPQVLTNDLSRGICSAASIRCLIVDEAHKALGNYAYCQVVSEISNYTNQFRIVALSATPGSDIIAVQKVLNNLLISKVELRTEDCQDIQPYTHQRAIDKIVVPVDQELKSYLDTFLKVMTIYVDRLSQRGAIFGKSPALLSKFQVLKAKEAFSQNPPGVLSKAQFGMIQADFSLLISLCHAYELLLLHGIRSFYRFLKGMMDGEKSQPRFRMELLRNSDFNELFDRLKEKYFDANFINKPLLLLNSRLSQFLAEKVEYEKPFIYGHPKLQKLEEIVVDHFKKCHSDNGPQGYQNTRVMIFSQFRDSVEEIREMFERQRPLVKVMSFIGQGNVSSKGLTQKMQIKVVKDFKEGGYNTLVSTCVGEEGLDIGEVDLIVCYDAPKSPIRLVQRMGRTGRRRQGRIVVLLTEGKEVQMYNQSQYRKTSIHKAISSGAMFKNLNTNSPRMIPLGVNPVCHQMHIMVGKYSDPQKKLSVTKNSKLMFKPTAKGVPKGGAFLNPGELEHWKQNLRLPPEEVPTLPATSTFFSLQKGSTRARGESDPNHPELSLTDWLPWQCTLQKAYLSGHSLRTRTFVQIVEFTQLQGDLDPKEDPYGMEMSAFLQQSDILLPGERETYRQETLPNFFKPEQHGKDKGPKRRNVSSNRSKLSKRLKSTETSNESVVFSKKTKTSVVFQDDDEDFIVSDRPNELNDNLQSRKTGDYVVFQDNDFVVPKLNNNSQSSDKSDIVVLEELLDQNLGETDNQHSLGNSVLLIKPPPPETPEQDWKDWNSEKLSLETLKSIAYHNVNVRDVDVISDYVEIDIFSHEADPEVNEGGTGKHVQHIATSKSKASDFINFGSTSAVAHSNLSPKKSGNNLVSSEFETVIHSGSPKIPPALTKVSQKNKEIPESLLYSSSSSKCAISPKRSKLELVPPEVFPGMSKNKLLSEKCKLALLTTMPNPLNISEDFPSKSGITNRESKHCQSEPNPVSVSSLYGVFQRNSKLCDTEEKPVNVIYSKVGAKIQCSAKPLIKNNVTPISFDNVNQPIIINSSVKVPMPNLQIKSDPVLSKCHNTNRDLKTKSPILFNPRTSTPKNCKTIQNRHTLPDNSPIANNTSNPNRQHTFKSPGPVFSPIQQKLATVSRNLNLSNHTLKFNNSEILFDDSSEFLKDSEISAPYASVNVPSLSTKQDFHQNGKSQDLLSVTQMVALINKSHREKMSSCIRNTNKEISKSLQLNGDMQINANVKSDSLSVLQFDLGFDLESSNSEITGEPENEPSVKSDSPNVLVFDLGFNVNSSRISSQPSAPDVHHKDKTFENIVNANSKASTYHTIGSLALGQVNTVNACIEKSLKELPCKSNVSKRNSKSFCDFDIARLDFNEPFGEDDIETVIPSPKQNNLKYSPKSSLAVSMHNLVKVSEVIEIDDNSSDKVEHNRNFRCSKNLSMAFHKESKNVTSFGSLINKSVDNPTSSKQSLNTSLKSKSDRSSDFESIRPVAKRKKMMIKDKSSSSSFWDSPPSGHPGSRTREVPSTKDPPPSKPKKKKKNKQMERPQNAFIQYEADLSGFASADDEDTSMDEYDSSFLDDRENKTQHVDIQAVYLRSVKSPNLGGVRSKFKLQYNAAHDDDVFSQSVQPTQDYMEDSFCVNNDEVAYVCSTGSEEDILTLKPKLKVQAAKTRRIQILISSSDEETVPSPIKTDRSISGISSTAHYQEPSVIDPNFTRLKPPPKKNKSPLASFDRLCSSFYSSNTNIIGDVSKKDQHKLTKPTFVTPEKTNEPLPDLLKNLSQDISKRISFGADEGQTIAFVDTRELSGGQAIISSLRKNHSLRVVAQQLRGGADYQLGTQVAVIRMPIKELSEVQKKKKLVEKVQEFLEFYDKPYLIVEKEKLGNKGSLTGSVEDEMLAFELFQLSSFDSTRNMGSEAGIWIPYYSRSRRPRSKFFTRITKKKHQTSFRNFVGMRSPEEMESISMTISKFPPNRYYSKKYSKKYLKCPEKTLEANCRILSEKSRPSQMKTKKFDKKTMAWNQFFSSLPFVNTAAALNFCLKFRSIQSFLKSSQKKIQEHGCISTKQAAKIYNYIHLSFL